MRRACIPTGPNPPRGHPLRRASRARPRGLQPPPRKPQRGWDRHVEMRAPGRWRSPPRSTARCGLPDVPRRSARRPPSTHLRAKPLSRKSCASLFACSSTVPVIISAWPFAAGGDSPRTPRSEEHTSELQSLAYLVCRLLLEKKKRITDKDDRYWMSDDVDLSAH